MDVKLDVLIKQWLKSNDVLFAIHPVDGSLLSWFVAPAYIPRFLLYVRSALFSYFVIFGIEYMHDGVKKFNVFPLILIAFDFVTGAEVENVGRCRERTWAGSGTL